MRFTIRSMQSGHWERTLYLVVCLLLDLKFEELGPKHGQKVATVASYEEEGITDPSYNGLLFYTWDAPNGSHT